MTEQQHRDIIKTLVQQFEEDLLGVERGSYAALREALDAAQADGVPASRFPQNEFRAWGVFTRDASGDYFVSQLERRMSRDGWR